MKRKKDLISELECLYKSLEQFSYHKNWDKEMEIRTKIDKVKNEIQKYDFKQSLIRRINEGKNK